MAIIGTLMLEILNRYSDVSSVEYRLTSIIISYNYFFWRKGVLEPPGYATVGENLGFG